ncbi:phage tail assembly chaperone [Parasphingorhabdus sp.]|uniref:phage tail assembly chaperone n=1 Tax=Parasphingorhabdus sp. TaxID=2709688 RepID=UPI0032671DFA
MRDDFRGAMFRLSGLISAIFGWSPEQFWSSTPAELHAVFMAWTEASCGSADIVPINRENLEQMKKDCPDG